MKLYVKHFWKVLPIIFTKDFWFTNKMLKKKRFGCLNRYVHNIYEIKQWAKKNGYSWDETWYLDSERYLYKNKVPVCMIQPYNPKIFTRYFAHQPDYTDELVENKTFLLNYSKTAKALFKFLNKEKQYLYDRDRIYEKINSAIYRKDKQYLDSNDFLTDLSHLSFGNYYDVLALKNDIKLTDEEKKEYIGDYCDKRDVLLDDYISFEDAAIAEKTNKDFDWNWTADFIPTALTRGAIDSVLCLNPNKIRGLKVTPELLDKMHDLFFKGL